MVSENAAQMSTSGVFCHCCATYALQRHVQEHSQGNEDVVQSVLQAFYVGNCLQSLQFQDQARLLTDKMRALLANEGFNMRQWSSNMPGVIAHLPPEAKSAGCDPQESTLCFSDRTLRPDHVRQHPKDNLQSVYSNAERDQLSIGVHMP